MLEHTIREANWGIWDLDLQKHWEFVNQIWADIFGHPSIKNKVREKKRDVYPSFLQQRVTPSN